MPTDRPLVTLEEAERLLRKYEYAVHAHGAVTARIGMSGTRLSNSAPALARTVVALHREVEQARAEGYRAGVLNVAAVCDERRRSADRLASDHSDDAEVFEHALACSGEAGECEAAIHALLDAPEAED